MSKGNSLIRIVLDRSGSMGNCVSITIDALNEYINSLKVDKVIGKITLSTFDSTPLEGIVIDTPYQNIPIDKFPLLTKEDLVPRGRTPLFDAVAEAIESIEDQKIMNTDKVIVVVVTDGQENDSRVHRDPSLLKQKIIDKEKNHDWLFLYIGADHDVFNQSEKMGFESTKTLSYSKRFSDRAFEATGNKTSDYLKGTKSVDIEFSDEERKKAKDG